MRMYSIRRVRVCVCAGSDGISDQRVQEHTSAALQGGRHACVRASEDVNAPEACDLCQTFCTMCKPKNLSREMLARAWALGSCLLKEEA